MTLQQLKYVVAVADCGTMSEAAKTLFISQPSLSGTIKELEKELDIQLFLRSNRGISVTVEGEEFLGYARQMLQQYHLIEDRFLNVNEHRVKFSVAMQHYTFAVQAFVNTANQFDMGKYEFACHETTTREVIRRVSHLNSQVGVLYVNEFNRRIMEKLFREEEVEFVPLFDCPIYVYLAANHPLAKNDVITFEELAPYPCLAFDQGENNSFYFAEEVLSTFDYRQQIRVNDRATMLNMMIGFHGYTLCSGIICTDLNGSSYTAIPFASEEKMTIGYIKKKNLTLDKLGQTYVEELKKYEDYIPTGQFEKPYLLQA